MAVQYATKEDMAYAAQVQKNKFVAKEEGKGLSTNDLTDELKAQIEGAQNAEQVQAAINTAVSGIYRVKGSSAFADLPTEGVVVGDVYNVTDDFTTTDAFAEGAGVSYPAGTNVVWTAEGDWDCMAGIYDFSDFVKASDIVDITNEEIDEMYADA